MVCRQLGFSEHTKGVGVKLSYFVRTSPRDYIIDKSQCEGKELKLADCVYRTMIPKECDAGRGAGVVCVDPKKAK